MSSKKEEKWKVKLIQSSKNDNEKLGEGDKNEKKEWEIKWECELRMGK